MSKIIIENNIGVEFSIKKKLEVLAIEDTLTNVYNAKFNGKNQVVLFEKSK
jgi:hypothetical protein